jgi:hypothetical protein
LINPESAYAKNAAAAMARSMDDVIITSFNASASTGVAGATSTALPSTQKTATSDQSDGLTIAKLRSAKYILDNNDIDPSLKRYLVCGFFKPLLNWLNCWKLFLLKTISSEELQVA